NLAADSRPPQRCRCGYPGVLIHKGQQGRHVTHGFEDRLERDRLRFKSTVLKPPTQQPLLPWVLRAITAQCSYDVGAAAALGQVGAPGLLDEEGMDVTVDEPGRDDHAPAIDQLGLRIA